MTFNERSYLLSDVYQHRVAAGRRVDFSAIQAWLRESPPIEDLDPTASSSISFVELWDRIARGASAALASALPDQPEVSVLNDLRENLALRLSQVGEGPVWEYFNAHRPLNVLLRAHLDADECASRRTLYCRVLEALRADALQELTTAYPVMQRHLSTTVASWLASSREILLRTHRDREMLTETFNVPKGARLVGVKTGMSDPHRGGSSVAILTFATASANQMSVVYKPRDIRIDAEYHKLVADVSATTPNVEPLRSLIVLPLDGYGYIEFVAHEICSSDKELTDFYCNAGRLAAILYILGCNDCHNENVIAQGSQLVLVDAETLLQAAPRRAIPDTAEATARDSLEARLGDSVMRIGLLPHWFFVAGERVPRDVSALGIEPPTAEHEAYTGWCALNTDGMVMGPAMRRTRLPTSLPVGVGSPNRLNDFRTDFCAGFRFQIEVIASDKGEWLGDEGRLERFRDLRSRFIRRPTWIYLWMRSKLLEPAALRDEAVQLTTMTRLVSPMPGDVTVKEEAVLIAERAQLRELDVPYFEQLIAGRDLVIDDAGVTSDFFAHSGLDAACRRIKSLESDDVHLQLAIIEGLIAAKARRAHRGQRRVAAVSPHTVGELLAEDRLEAAAAVGDLLIDASIADDRGNLEWLGIDSAADLERSCFGPIGPTLYSGRLGIALFLAALASVGSDRRTSIYRKAAIAACADLARILELTDASSDKRMWWRDQPLGLAGSGGQLLAAVLLGKLMPGMQRVVDDGLSELLGALDPEIISSDNDLDIIFGCAGLIGPLLRIGTTNAIDLARIAGNRLVDRQNDDGGWIVPTLGRKPLTGFSHGASGAAAALAKLVVATNYCPYYDAAARALQYERAQYDAREKNWPDYRISLANTEPQFMLSWCHGAPGIALARLCMKSTPLWDSNTAEDLELALTATTEAARGEDSLCCGRFGRAAILRAAHERVGEERWLKAAGHLETQAMAQIATDGSYSLGDVLGLFQGAAGIGLELLDGLPQVTSAFVPQVLSAGLIDYNGSAIKLTGRKLERLAL
jgi:type 2 lantibiotic biosynthesis protein LanM